ncbi:MAG: hypothetical protein O7E52_05780 [Candidatus Poribacteria bacterium]|nr:hypothetical protein [Candidatus Poribacteria bacterium]
MPLDQLEGNGQCIVCGNPASEMTIFGRSY